MVLEPHPAGAGAAVTTPLLLRIELAKKQLNAAREAWVLRREQDIAALSQLTGLLEETAREVAQLQCDVHVAGMRASYEGGRKGKRKGKKKRHK